MENVEKKVRVGIVGIGNIGSAHLRSIGDGHVVGMTLAAACDISASRREFCRAQYPDVPVFDSADGMIKSGLCDAVIVSVPHPHHAEIAGAALRAGLHVLVEKPEDVSVSAAAELNRIASGSGKVFGIMFNQRTNPLFARARELVRGGEIGKLQRSVWIITNWYRTQAYYNSGSWRATWRGEGGGVLLNQAPHNLDLWQWICGMPEEITAFCDVGKYHDIEVEDDATIFARYPGGATGTFITTTGEYPGTNRLEITGDKGKIVIENGTLRLWKLSVSSAEFSASAGEHDPKPDIAYSEYVPDGKGEGHRGILRNFAEAVLTGSGLLAPGYDGINELSISNAAYLSSWTGKSVKLPLDASEFDRLLSERRRNGADTGGAAETKTDGEYLDRWQVNF